MSFTAVLTGTEPWDAWLCFASQPAVHLCESVSVCSHLSAFPSPGMVPPGFSLAFPTYLVSQPD